MNYNKLALKSLLTDNNPYLLQHLTENYFTKSYKTIYRLVNQFYDKHNKLPKSEDLIALFETKLPEDKAATFTAIIKSLDKLQTNLSPEEILEGLKEVKALTEVEENLELLINYAENKDVKNLTNLLNNLSNKLQNTFNDFIPTEASEVEFKNISLASVSNCLPTLSENGVDFYGLSIIGAGSGSGKSILSLQQAIFAYEIEGLNVAFLSLELDESLLLMRMYSQVTNTPFREILSNPNKKEIIDTWKSEYFNRDNKFYIKHRRYTTEELRQVIKTLIKQGVKLFVIDYLNLVEFENNKEEWKQLANLVKDLHELAVNNGVVIISPTQIEIEESKSGRVHAVTRGSKELLYSSSVFLLLYQDKEEAAENVSRVIVQKARNSTKLTCMLENDFQHMKFKDLGITV